MTDIATVTLLYTANLAGDLRLLPRLFTLIQRERRAAEGPVFLLDLGDTCALESWICRATQGRAPLIVLDAMGYDIALVGGPEQVSIPVDSLRRLLDTVIMPVMPWGRATSLTRRGIQVGVASGEAALPPDYPGIRVDRVSDALPPRGQPGVTLGDVPGGCLARVTMGWPEWTAHESDLLILPPDLPADPTIGAVVDFVESEARFYVQQHGGESI